MKKTMTIFGTILFASFIFVGCGPTACDCLDAYSPGSISMDNKDMLHYNTNGNLDKIKPCIEKFGKDIPDNLRGTNQFRDAMINKLQKECNK